MKNALISTGLAGGMVAAIFSGSLAEDPVFTNSIVKLESLSKPTNVEFEGAIYRGRCGITNIGDGYGVTASHCVEGFDVIVGGESTSHKFVTPATYRVENLRDDIALVKDAFPKDLKAFETISDDEVIKHIVGPLTKGEFPKVLAVGYGTTQLTDGLPDVLSENLKILETVIVEYDKYHTVVKDPTGKGGVCVGDSGSSLLISVNGIWKIVGVVSYVTPDAQGNICTEPGFETTYQSINRHQKWINQVKNFCNKESDPCLRHSQQNQS